MTRWFLSILFLVGGSLVFSIEPHPDAAPNTHAPGEVDLKANLKFIIPNPDALPGIVLDETSAILKGKWQYSTHTPPYVGIGYLHDQKSDKGKKSATFIPDFPRSGKYEVRLSHCYNSRRSTATPVTRPDWIGATRVTFPVILKRSLPPSPLLKNLDSFAVRFSVNGAPALGSQPVWPPS